MTTANREIKSRQIGAHMMALLVCTVWATTFVCSKELLAYYTPAQVMLMRFVLAYFVLWLLRPRPLRWQGRGELTFLLMGILGGTLYFWTENTALQHTFAANVSIIVAMAPILTSILAHFSPGMKAAYDGMGGLCRGDGRGGAGGAQRRIRAEIKPAG